jgi:hypothetical protein
MNFIGPGTKLQDGDIETVAKEIGSKKLHYGLFWP